MALLSIPRVNDSNKLIQNLKKKSLVSSPTLFNIFNKDICSPLKKKKRYLEFKFLIPYSSNSSFPNDWIKKKKKSKKTYLLYVVVTPSHPFNHSTSEYHVI